MSCGSLACYGVLVAQLDLVWRSPTAWALTLGALGLWMMLNRASLVVRTIGQLAALGGLATLAANLPLLGGWGVQAVFWLLSIIILGSAAAAVTCRSPLYTAIWFALSLLGTAGLFLFQGAQFLGVATVVVYAGAIVVTFLFVLMLAQAQGLADYDRTSWSRWASPAVLLAVVAVMGLLMSACSTLRVAALAAGPGPAAPIAANQDHVAHFGSQMFATYLISIEVVGTLLLVALVGAVVIVIQGRAPRTTLRTRGMTDNGAASTSGSAGRNVSPLEPERVVP